MSSMIRHRDEIKQKALEIFLVRMRENIPGDIVSDWLQAEAIIMEKISLSEPCAMPPNEPLCSAPGAVSPV